VSGLRRDVALLAVVCWALLATTGFVLLAVQESRNDDARAVARSAHVLVCEVARASGLRRIFVVNCLPRRRP